MKISFIFLLSVAALAINAQKRNLTSTPDEEWSSDVASDTPGNPIKRVKYEPAASGDGISQMTKKQKQDVEGLLDDKKLAGNPHLWKRKDSIVKTKLHRLDNQNGPIPNPVRHNIQVQTNGPNSKTVAQATIHEVVLSSAVAKKALRHSVRLGKNVLVKPSTSKSSTSEQNKSKSFKSSKSKSPNSSAYNRRCRRSELPCKEPSATPKISKGHPDGRNMAKGTSAPKLSRLNPATPHIARGTSAPKISRLNPASRNIAKGKSAPKVSGGNPANRNIAKVTSTYNSSGGRPASLNTRVKLPIPKNIVGNRLHSLPNKPNSKPVTKQSPTKKNSRA